jgi:hypothetical protein
MAIYPLNREKILPRAVYKLSGSTRRTPRLPSLIQIWIRL